MCFLINQQLDFKEIKICKTSYSGHLIKDGKVAKKKLEKQQGKSKICNTTTSALCCMQVGNINTFRSNRIKSFQHIPYHSMQQ